MAEIQGPGGGWIKEIGFSTPAFHSALLSSLSSAISHRSSHRLSHLPLRTILGVDVDDIDHLFVAENLGPKRK